MLQYVKECTDLGIVIDDHLRFDTMVTKKVREAVRRGNFLWRLYDAPKRKRRALWCGFVGSYIFYGLPALYPSLTQVRKNELERVYVNAAKSICGLIPSTYGSSAVQEAGMEPFKECISRRRENLLNRMNGVKHNSVTESRLTL